MQVSINKFCTDNRIRLSEVEKIINRLSDKLHGHICRKDRIYIDEVLQELIRSEIRNDRKRSV